MTLTLDRVILHTVMHHSSTSSYTPNFIKIEVSFCGRMVVRMGGRTFETHFIRSTQRSRPNKVRPGHWLKSVPWLCFIIICPIAIAYSMGQIIKSFCVCACVCPSVDTLTVAFLRRFSPNWSQTCKPPKVRTSSLVVNIAPPLSLFSP